jgi:hypothetical protein
MSLEIFEHFLRQSEASGVKVWLSGLQPDLLKAFDRLKFHEWFPAKRLFPSKYDEYSSTIDAVKHIRRELPAQAGNTILSEELSYQA